MNIGLHVDCAVLRDFAETLPNVVIARTNKFTCSDPGQNIIKNDILELDLNRIVVAACTPKIHEPTFRELATCGFLQQHENLFLVGPSGVGKSHLAEALGHEACRKGFEVLYRRTAVLMDWIQSGHGDGTHPKRLKQVGSVQLLILDDFGLTPLSDPQQADLYELICERYEKHSTILTSNRDFNEWPMVFTNPLMGSAAMDRLVHRAVKIVIEGKSYRVDSFVKRSKQPLSRDDGSQR